MGHGFPVLKRVHVKQLILTHRLEITRMAAADAAAVYAYRHLPEVRRFQSFEPRSPADVEHFIAGMQSDHFGDPGPWLWFKGEWVDDVVYAILESSTPE